MPLALALQNATAVLKEAVRALAPWLDIVPREETIVERTRSAFLVHWFGQRLPFDGLSLRAYIVNLDAVSQQYLMAQQSIPSSASGPNLTGPLLGFAGMLSGVLLSPAGAVAGVYVMLKFAGASVKTILAAIGWLLIPALLVAGTVAAPAGTAVLFGGLIAAGAGGYALAGGLADRRDLRAIFDLFGGLARLMNAIAGFLGQLTGDRSRVRNPLLARILALSDVVAALLAQGLGAVAVFVRRIGPILRPMAQVLVALGRLVGSAMGALGEIFAAPVPSLAPGPIVERVKTAALGQLERVHNAFTEQLDVIATALGDVAARLKDAFVTFFDRLSGFIVDRVAAHPVSRVMDAFKTQIGVFRSALASAPPPPAPPPGQTPAPSPLAPLLAALPALPPTPTFPALPTLPDAARIARALRVESVPEINAASIEAAADRLGRAREPSTRIELGPDARAALARALRRPSVFEPERRALELELGRSPEQALELNRQNLARFRETFSVVVGRVLPPELRAVYAPKLAEVLSQIDRQLYGIEAASPAPELPVVDLPTNDRLRPVVRTIRLRMPGAELNDVKRFRDLVLERLRARSYSVRSEAAAGAH